MAKLNKDKYWFFPEGIYKGQIKGGAAHGKGTYTSGFKGKKENINIFIKAIGLMVSGKAKVNKL